MTSCHFNIIKIEKFIVTKLAKELNISPADIDIRKAFSTYGIDSKTAVSLSGELCDFLGVDLPVTLLWDYPTVEKLTQAVITLTGSKKVTETSAILSDHTHNFDDAIAVIGIGCKFPKSKNLAEFLDLLMKGKDAIQDCAPKDRNCHKEYPGGYLENATLFDKSFFNLTSDEVLHMDPQQRLLLEVAMDALVDAGQPCDKLTGSSAGVFVGICANDYGYRRLIDSSANIFTVVGNCSSITANRLSYFLDLHGPSMAIDTACSSSLAAVHLACQSLKSNDCELAIAAGVNLLFESQVSMALEQAGMLSADGRCKTFANNASGYVRGEGVGVVILKPLNIALRDNDQIYAVILGSAMNQDGCSNGLTAPNIQSQVEVVKKACSNAKILPGQLQYVELHGTGTELGDVIEAQALGVSLQQGRKLTNFCRVGSVKSNIGHLEAAAGIAGLIKVCLSIKEKKLLPSINFDVPNRHIPFANLPIKIQKTVAEWPEKDSTLLAGVSSFGFGGTNVHVVLASVPNCITEKNTAAIQDDTALIFPISAKSEKALKAVEKNYLNFLQENISKYSFGALAYNACVRSSHHDARVAVVASNTEELLHKLEEHNYIYDFSQDKNNSLVFVFSGQGQQYFGMGADLFRRETIFREAIIECDRIFQQYANWSLVNIFPNDEFTMDISNTEIAQPLIFALQYGIAMLWDSWGIKPNAVVGHSMGEVTAACVAGIISLDEAIRLIYFRGAILQEIKDQGQMIVVQLEAQKLKLILEKFSGEVVIAAYNSVDSNVVSGNIDCIKQLIEFFAKEKINYHKLPGNYAFHGGWLGDLADRMVEKINVLPSESRCAFYSTVTGKEMRSSDLTEDYWKMNVSFPVKFINAVNNLVDDGYKVFLEISPQRVLSGNVNDILREFADENLISFSSIQSKYAERAQMLNALAQLYTLNFPVNWQVFFSKQFDHITLPGYPWQYKPYWLDVKVNVMNAETIGEKKEKTEFQQLTGELGQLHKENDQDISKLEFELIDLLESLLNRKNIKRDDNFFVLGGSSLVATQMVIRLNKMFGLEITLRDIFDCMTVAKLANKIESMLGQQKQDMGNNEKRT